MIIFMASEKSDTEIVQPVIMPGCTQKKVCQSYLILKRGIFVFSFSFGELPIHFLQFCFPVGMVMQNTTKSNSIHCHILVYIFLRYLQNCGLPERGRIINEYIIHMRNNRMCCNALHCRPITELKRKLTLVNTLKCQNALK